MLFILTGEVQTGKTRWLSELTLRLSEENIPCYGVLTPGTWKREDTSFEKLGIEAVLLPQNQVIPFAKRGDLVLPEEHISKQSSSLGLHWCIFEGALQEVNEHFSKLHSKVCTSSATGEGQTELTQDKTLVSEAGGSHKKGLLIVDELGKLEFEIEQGGLTGAFDLLDEGATELYDHALIVVRSSLYAQAEARFKGSWARVQALYPTESAAQGLLNVLM